MSEVFIYVTCESDEQAADIGKTLVAQRLVACVNLIGGMKSFYWWDGGVQSGNETVLIAKSTDALAGKATERIKKLHSYKVPCVVVLPIAGGNPDFLAWIREETQAG